MYSEIMKVFTSFILLFFMFQTVLFGSGLYGVILEGEALLCTCNHASEKEVHQNEEDKMFKSSLTKTIQHHEHEEKVKPSCHSPKKGEAHLCDCKKANKKSEFIRSFIQNNYLKGEAQLLSPESVLLFTVQSPVSAEKCGYGHEVNRPPKHI